MRNWIRSRAGGIRWQVDPAWQASLLISGEIALEEWLRTGQARVVKSAPHRVVYHVSLPGLSCYVKHNRLTEVKTWLRELIRPSKARTECRKALLIAERGVPTVCPIAIGEGIRGLLPGESFCVTLALPEVEPLETFLNRTFTDPAHPCPAAARQHLTENLARFLAQMHDAGVLHPDLHPGNIVVRTSGNCQEMFLIDVHSVSVGRPVAIDRGRDNLVVLNHWFALRASRTDRLRFWKAYCKARKALTTRPSWAMLRLLAADMEHRTEESNLILWQRRDLRCLRNNRQFRRVESPQVVGHAVRVLEPTVLAPFLENPDALFRRPGVRLLKNSRSSTVGEFELFIHGSSRKVIYKRFWVTAWHDPLTGLVRRTPALRSWVLGQALLERILPTATPLLVLHRRRFGLAREGYLLMDKIEGAVDLHVLMIRLAELSADQRRLAFRAYSNRVARMILQLHHCRMSHRDLKAANILVSDPRLGRAAPDCWLIDLVGVRQQRRLAAGRRARNLARLNASFHGDPSISRADRLRFLLAYLQIGLHGREDWRTWWKCIADQTQEKVARNLRRQRILR